MTQVELIYNHITNKSYLFIDSKPAPKLGRVTKYLTMPFHDWYRGILPEIYREVNDEFELFLVAREFECELFDKANSGYDKCVGIRYGILQYESETLDRLHRLQNAVRRLPSRSLRIQVYSDVSGRELMHDAQMDTFWESSLIIPDYSLEALDVLEDRINNEEEYELKCDARFVFLYETDTSEVSVKGLDRMPGNTYIFGTSAEYERGWIEDSVYYEQFEPGNAREKIKKWLDYEALPSLLENLMSGLNPDPSDRNGMELCMLDQVEPMTFVKGVECVDLGGYVSVDKYYYPDEESAPKIELTSSASNVISVQGAMLRGENIGTSVISAYIPGNPAPIKTFYMQCIKRNPIQQIDADTEDCIITAGDTVSIQYHYYPEDADNVQEIRCYSDNPSVVSVDEDACTFEAVSEGNATVVIEAGEARAEINIEVYPALEEIYFTPNAIQLYIGESASFTIGYSPENVLDTNFTIESSGPGEVQVDQESGKIVAVNAGGVVLTAKNADGSVSGSLNIVVKKPFDAAKVLLPIVMAAGIAIVVLVFRALFG